ncbi:hypothetical protein V7095_07900 [Bacillus thuringiensis]|uniref:hypothetical protein n=1 Tax=Bacillus thuringiensis TaxID=1428 RepID=UPI003000A3FE
MNSNFEFIEDKEKNDELMSIYFNFINGKYLERALSFFVKKEGFGQEIVFVHFQSDLDEFDMSQLPIPLDDKRVLVELDSPAVESEQQVYLDFETFYNYLEEHVKKKVEKNPERNGLMDLLVQVKRSLNL